MGIDDLFDKAKEAASSEKAEEISDNVLDGAAKAADKVTGGKFSEQIDGVRDTLDEKFGDE